jgi:pimeloyl-ACP methyl ester carboxylesterase
LIGHLGTKMSNTENKVSAGDTPTRFTFNCGATALSGLDFGNPAAPDMILLHGIRDLAWSMVGIAREFSSDFHVVVPDLRGHGDSDNVGLYTMNHFVADLRALIEQRELKDLVLIAHSLGGHIAAQYTALYGEEIRALVLIDGMGPPHYEMDAAEEKAMMRQRIQLLTQNTSSPRVMKDVAEAQERLLRNNPRLDSAMARLLAEQGTWDNDGGGVFWKWDSRADQVWNTFSSKENEARLGWVTCPVLLITAEYSMQYWEQLREVLKNRQEHHDAEVERRRQIFSNARHQSIKGAGHMIHYDQPEHLNRTLRDFVDEL